MRLFEFLLVENRVDYLRKLFQEKIWNKAHEMERPGFSSSFQNPETFFDVILTTDPSGDKKYAQWVIRCYLRGHFRVEDIDRIKEQLERFDQLKPRLDPKLRDIMQYKGPGELYMKVIKPNAHVDATSQRQIDAAADKELKDQVRVVYKGPEGAIYVPTTQEASCFLGRGTQWCTAASKSHNAFHDYNREGPLYIVITPDGRKVQMHFPSGQFMDETDTEIPEFPDNDPGDDWGDDYEPSKPISLQDYKWIAKVPEIAKAATTWGALWLFENPPEEVKKTAIRRFWKNIYKIKNPSEELLQLAMDVVKPARPGHLHPSVEKIAKDFALSPRLQLHAVHTDPHAIRGMQNPTPEVQEYVAQAAPKLIAQVKNPDMRALQIAIRRDPRMIGNLPEERQTPELQEIAMRILPSVILDIKRPTMTAVGIAAERSGEYLLRASRKYEYQIPERLQIVMVKKFPYLMKQINPSPRVIQAYNEWLSQFDKGAQDYLGGLYKPRAAESRR